MRSQSASLLAGVLILAGGFSLAARGVPILDNAPGLVQQDGTISGTVRGADGSTGIEGRAVAVANIDTGQRQQLKTGSTGGFTVKVKPGKYRIEVTLAEGEAIIEQPGVMDISKSDIDAQADFVLGVARTPHPHHPTGLTGSVLGPPIA